MSCTITVKADSRMVEVHERASPGTVPVTTQVQPGEQKTFHGTSDNRVEVVEAIQER